MINVSLCGKEYGYDLCALICQNSVFLLNSTGLLLSLAVPALAGILRFRPPADCTPTEERPLILLPRPEQVILSFTAR
ncbi:hypothetical protein [Xenorhabdus szentirmaii]|uniref:hypothetical protein n=1 Tax=Xenorhabdus szentirmaii TaxID=290112 RepID=UPI002B4054A7|nr:hypothetical protein [Xenorhabdus sp. ZM]